MLFSEPKIPQLRWYPGGPHTFSRFQCSSASRKFLNFSRGGAPEPVLVFQCSSASRKFLNSGLSASVSYRIEVSVLFSEPKIPQRHPRQCRSRRRPRFSALQRAENSSTRKLAQRPRKNDEFQCSSASRKFLNVVTLLMIRRRARVSVLFSEPKIPQLCSRPNRRAVETRFQCSSASRKFLNPIRIPQHCARLCVSVLFSEPKIPQVGVPDCGAGLCFAFQCSSASRKFLNLVMLRVLICTKLREVSVLFSEPKIPQRCAGCCA